VGLDVHRTARICGAAHGGQILLSQTTRDLLEAEVRDLDRAWAEARLLSEEQAVELGLEEG
jgi:class 3 adenylate cyclase